MRKRIGISLEARLCLLTIATLFAVMLGVGHLALNEHRSVVMEQNQTAYLGVTEAIALSSSELVSGRNPETVDGLRSQLRNRHMELEYVIIADRQGRTLFVASDKLPNSDKSEGVRWWTVVRKILGYGGIDPENVYPVTVPVVLSGDRPATVTAGFRLNEAKAALDLTQSKVLAGIAIGLLVGVMCAVAMGRGLTRSLRTFIDGSKSVTEGNYDFRVPVTSQDEFGKLAESFNYMIETLGDSHQQLIEKANTDSLTGLNNHRYFQEHLGLEMRRSDRYNRPLSLLMIDIDYFKSFNDAHGHPLGDAGLRELAEVIIDNIRETDVAARYGGEEFTVVLPETSLTDAMATAERIRQAIQDHPFRGANDDNVKLTASVGAAEYPLQCTDRPGLILASDIALYQAKALGRNKVACYDTSMPGIPEADPYRLYVLLHAHDLSTIEALAEAVDAKLKFPSGHSRSVALLASETAKKLGVEDAECASIYLAALLRDIGQIAISDAILTKAARLTKDEMAAISQHPALGHAIVQKAPHLSCMLPAILHHHERFDGSGYPAHLAGDKIPLPARIIAVADAYQSMVTERPHRRQMTNEEACKELTDKSASQFDPKIVAAFIGLLNGEQSTDRAA